MIGGVIVESKVFETVLNCIGYDQESVWFGCKKLSGIPNHPKIPEPDWYGTVSVSFVRFGHGLA